jgi:DNA-binding response OmpR family regulator
MAATILIVEDEPDLVETLVAILEDAGFEVQVATNGTSGIAAYTASHPDAVLLDGSVPLMGWAHDIGGDPKARS